MGRVCSRLRGGAEGAAAVEFALVLPVLLVVLFGMLDYGIFFNNSLSVKQGAREAARQGIVGNYGNACGMTWAVAPSANMQRVGCTAVDRTSAVTGTVHVKVRLPNGWVKGKSLIVCEMVQSKGLTGFVPMPNGGVTTTKVEMSIEKATTGQTESGGEQSPPSGVDWSWC